MRTKYKLLILISLPILAYILAPRQELYYYISDIDMQAVKLVQDSVGKYKAIAVDSTIEPITFGISINIYKEYYSDIFCPIQFPLGMREPGLKGMQSEIYNFKIFLQTENDTIELDKKLFTYDLNKEQRGFNGDSINFKNTPSISIAQLFKDFYDNKKYASGKGFARNFYERNIYFWLDDNSDFQLPPDSKIILKLETDEKIIVKTVSIN